ncbi:hypothetical protein SDRG_02833 [Saprolegnia diclina VS20]|uniref:Uncharacterized protein n=1 Tax=Saprolegnia diclina (strain VS20) TaxID=1156394 RepID=T0R1I1_SAPDV|nr:hypothetical protein SDRG_02833 [Saprolegnia diclina VS20]EQC40185.1 hypothetical protein SDRG_02833 [Saprolegnia diclina VS20]|eukprot:XP_008606659.1 hypothetical protein SDRG_02833 [Saprolegnia diclina VS20]
MDEVITAMLNEPFSRGLCVLIILLQYLAIWVDRATRRHASTSRTEVRSAWGRAAASPVASSGNYYYRSTHSTRAYMLMYRPVDARRNGQFLPDDALPEGARLIPLEIFYDSSHKTLHVSKLLALSDVMAQAQTLFGLDLPSDHARLRTNSEYTSLPLEDSLHSYYRYDGVGCLEVEYDDLDVCSVSINDRRCMW